MAERTYLQLVNDAVIESKVTLDPLTVENFHTPPRTDVYNRFKKWINQAYEELFMHNKQWYFRVGRTSLQVWPRLHLQNLVVAPAVGDEFSCRTSGIEFRVMKVHTFEVIEGSGMQEATVSVEFLNSPYRNPHYSRIVFGEVIDQTLPLPAVLNAGAIKGLGFYDFRSELPYLESIIMDTVKAHPLPEDTPYPYNYYPALQGQALFPTRVGEELHPRGMQVWANGLPNSISETRQGYFQILPHPTHSFLLEFDFTKKIIPMVQPQDIPTALPPEYHDYLMWKAVAEYADWDRNASVYSRAKKHLDNFDFYLFRDQTRIPAIGEGLFTGG